jgi:hypothetical protein
MAYWINPHVLVPGGANVAQPAPRPRRPLIRGNVNFHAPMTWPQASQSGRARTSKVGINGRWFDVAHEVITGIAPSAINFN